MGFNCSAMCGPPPLQGPSKEEMAEAAIKIQAVQRMMSIKKDFSSRKELQVQEMFIKSPALAVNATLQPYKADIDSMDREGRIFIKVKSAHGFYTGFVQAKYPYLSDGLGIMQCQNQQVYEGEWLLGKKNGNGRLVEPEGCVYIGAWKDDEQTGYGSYWNPTKGYKYEGEWKQKNYDGQGKETFEKIGASYTGSFVGGKKQGQGRFEFSDGSFYQGDFLDGQFHGQGTYFFKDEDKTFIGDFINGKIEGQGREVWGSGVEYVGQFRNGQKHGQGTLTIPNQTMYQGAWERNMKHGIGWEVQLKGPTKRKGEWKKNKLARWLSKTETFTRSGKNNDEFGLAKKEEAQPAIELDQLSVRSDLDN